MGINLRDIITPHEIEWNELSGKIIAIDAMNNLYQFLATIRQPDGTPLTDANGNPTSHLTGLFYRSIRIYEHGIKLCYVFDGKPWEYKAKELERRKEIKTKAELKWKEALEAGDLKTAKKYASMTSRFTPEMKEESKQLLKAMGIPVVEAPSEGEMQCAYMAKTGKVYATASQDYDSLLCGSPLLIRNLTMVEKYHLELIRLDEVLKELRISQDNLIDMALMIGTDFNTGIKGIGPKKALKAVKNGNLQLLKQLEVEPSLLHEVFKNPIHTDDYKLEWTQPSEEAVLHILVDNHDFSETRVKHGLTRLNEAYNKTITQSSLADWF
jgi:flap endonuclease-1